MIEERTISYALRVKLPEEDEQNRGFKECCYENIVLAHPSDSDEYKNDFYLVFEGRQLPTDTCDLFLVDGNGNDYPIINTTYGTGQQYGNAIQPDLLWFIVDWRKVLNTLGEGMYYVRKEITIAGIPFIKLTNTFTLKTFTKELADHTVRFDSTQNGYLEHYNVNFKNTGCKTSLRIKGFFGRREPEYTQENDVYRDETVVQNNMWQENEYVFQANLIPECITEELFDFLMFGNQLYMNDYNWNNHSYKYKKFPVVYKSNKGTKYYVYNRSAQINMSFEDRIKNKRKINC